MFSTLTTNLTNIFERLKSGGVLTESQINEAMRDIRIALLEADVALPVVKDFISVVKEKALGQEVIKSISPGQLVVKIIHDELVNILSFDKKKGELNLNQKPPASILIAGLQGGGKTTASAKLALFLKNQGKKILLVSLDTYRPAAQEQLKILATSIEVDSLPIISNENPIEITQRAIKEGKLAAYDVIIYDTAGRLHIDEEMIKEIQEIKDLIDPIERLLVVDAMTGQDAVNVANHFNQKIDITGIILSRIDGDTKGGAALSIKYVINKPIKFLSSGEKLATLEKFDAKRIAGRILDMGDVVSLVEKAVAVMDESTAKKTADRIQKGQFNLNDYLNYLESIKKMGGLSGILAMLPGVSKMMSQVNQEGITEDIIIRQQAIIRSMHTKERLNPKLLDAKRRKRIASGSGTKVQDINKLMQQYTQIHSLMKKMKSMGPKSLMKSMFGAIR